MNDIINHDLCTGCLACYNVCPAKCIELKRDMEGFIFPNKGKNCIECKKCEKVCPRLRDNSQENNGYIQQAFAAISKNKEVWKRSSSGGAFSEICRAWDDGETDFVGASWSGLSVEHQLVSSIKDIKRFRKSKYIQSNIGEIYSRIEDKLKAGRKLVFCGTPCQVAGLKAFLGRDYDKLLTVDIICHGVGSPIVFQECIRLLEKQFGSTIIHYEFRHKDKYYRQDHIQRIEFDNHKSLLVENDPYIQLFTSQDCLRKSCGKNCIYRDANRQGDITIGDFKHLFDVFPEQKDERYNYSSIIVNSAKGEKVLSVLERNMILKECSIDSIKEYNPIFWRHTFFSERRNSFFEGFSKDAQGTLETWVRPASKYEVSLKRKVLDNLPCFIRSRIKRKLAGGK